MGLDTVELVIAIEDAFEVRIGNDDAAKLTTPAEVTDYLMARLRTDSGDPCPSQAGFYHIRSVLITPFGIPRQQIHPDSSWSDRLWSREAVLAKVIAITSEQLGIRIDQISPDSHFVYALGAD